MYFDYAKERQGLEVLEKEHGFALYKITGEEMFLAEVYIKPEFRKTKAIHNLIFECSQVGLQNKCKVMSATVHLSDLGAMRTIKAALKLDFFIARAHDNIIVIAKHLGGENG